MAKLKGRVNFYIAVFLSLLAAFAAAQSLQNFGGAAAAVPETWSHAFKLSDQAITNNQVSTADAALTFAALANKTYAIELVLDFTTDVTTGARWTIQCPAAPTRVSIDTCYNGTGTSFACVNTGSACAVDVANANTNTSLQVQIKGRIVNVNAGNINLAWAQNASGAAAVTLRAGSYLRYRQIN